jgi:hypothetical protein
MQQFPSNQDCLSPNVADYVAKAFTSGVIKVEVISDQARIEKEFALLGAVSRV